jgi:G3E family GTPase
VSAADDAPAAVPLTILTGFLGAGKTTALNRVLGAPHGRRLAILVNELGRIAIDGRLILRRGGDVLELAGGCICCKVDLKSDLWDGIGEVIRRSRPDQVVLETTGIAEPSAIIDGLHRVAPEVRDLIVPAGVVCVVDAEVAPATLAAREEARDQLAVADRVLIAKLDRASAEQVRAVHAALDQYAPAAERASFPPRDDGDMALTAWLLERRALIDASVTGAARAAAHAAEAHHHGHHHHGSQLVAVAFADDAPLVAEQVRRVIDDLGPALVRAKGFVHLAGEPRRGFLERAGAIDALRLEQPWGDATPRTELVLIGDGLDEAAVRRALWACRAGA